MHCPHCHGRLPAPRPVNKSGRFKVCAHHGKMDLDTSQLAAMAENAMAHLTNRNRIQEILGRLGVYEEVMQRMEHDPAFARHVLSCDGDGGRRFFPGSTKAARLAEFRKRVRSGDVREGDLLRYIEIMTDQ